MSRSQSGFTLVEIAVVLVIIGLLLGGVLKGQELIASARVRNLADQQSGIQAAYYGFVDRYRAVPGDMDATAAKDAIGVSSITCGGNSDGHLVDPTDSSAWNELDGVWEQLSKAGFIKGSYEGGDTTPGCDEPDSNNNAAPVNVYSSPLILAFAQANKFENGSAQRLALFMGQNVPVDIARELDVKLDDGKPQSGILRNATSNSGTPLVYQSADNCIGSSNQWNVSGNVQNCQPVYLF